MEPGPIAAGLMEQLRVDELGALSLQDGDLSGTAGLPLTDLDITGRSRRKMSTRRRRRSNSTPRSWRPASRNCRSG